MSPAKPRETHAARISTLDAPRFAAQREDISNSWGKALGINNLKCVLHGGMESKELFCSGLLLCVGCSVWLRHGSPAFSPVPRNKRREVVRMKRELGALWVPHVRMWLSEVSAACPMIGSPREAIILLSRFAEAANLQPASGLGSLPTLKDEWHLSLLLWVSGKTLNACSSTVCIATEFLAPMRGS